MRLRRAIDLYIDVLAGKGHPPSTRERYQWLLFLLADSLDSECQVAEITTDDLREFMRRWRNTSNTTKAQRVSILRGFFAFLAREGKIERDPALLLDRPRRPRSDDLDVATLSTDEVGRLFAACQEIDELLIVSLFSYLGPRRAAVAKARWGDADFAEGTIRLHEKGGKVNVVPMPDELANLLYEIGLSGHVPAAPEDYIVPNRRSGWALTYKGVTYVSNRKPRTGKFLWKRVKEIAARAGIEPKKARPHALRAAFAVAFDDAHPNDLIALKELMGHARIETTLVYLRRKDKAKAKEKVRDLSWRGVIRPPALMPPAGFEPAFPVSKLPDPLQGKLDELKTRQAARGERDCRR